MTPNTLLDSTTDSQPDRYRWPYCLSLLITIALLFLPSEITPLAATNNKIPATNQGKQTPGFCTTEPSGQVVYFSQIYDTRLKQPVKFSTNAIAQEFIEYLKGRYNFKSSSNFPASCSIFSNMTDAEAIKRKLEAQARQANRQVVQVDWRYVVDEDLVAASYSYMGEDVAAVVAGRRKPDHMYCLSDSAQGTLYTTGPVEAGLGPNLHNWNRGFTQLLQQKYSFNGPVECNMGRVQELGRLVAARSEGARAAGKKVVDTRWKYDPAAVATTAKPAKRDDDPEPVQRPAPPNPSRQARDMAAKEMPESVAFCRKDPSLPLVFNCDSFGREVYNYRMAHPGDKETVASLVATNKLNCAPCIDNTRVSIWISNRGAADKLDNRVINCVTQNVIVTLYKKPEASQLKQFYNDALATCRK